MSTVPPNITGRSVEIDLFVTTVRRDLGFVLRADSRTFAVGGLRISRFRKIRFRFDSLRNVGHRGHGRHDGRLRKNGVGDNGRR